MSERGREDGREGEGRKEGEREKIEAPSTYLIVGDGAAQEIPVCKSGENGKTIVCRLGKRPVTSDIGVTPRASFSLFQRSLLCSDT